MGWMRYAHEHELSSIFHSCKRYVSDSFLEVSKEKEFIRLSLNDLSITLQLLNNVVSPDNLLTSVLSWISYDKESRKNALDYTSGYMKLKYCKKQFLSESTKQHIDIFKCNPEFKSRVAHLLHPKKLSLVVIGGDVIRSGNSVIENTRGWKLESETKFVEITGLPSDLLNNAPSICQYGWNKLILTGTRKEVCVVFEMSTKKWKKLKDLKKNRVGHASVCVQQELLTFGGMMDLGESIEWSDSVEFLNVEQDQEWQKAPPMPSILTHPKVSKEDTDLFLMGDKNPVLYLFDGVRKVWSQIASMPQNPGTRFGIAAGNDSVYATGGVKNICWRYIVSTDTWSKLSSPALVHGYAALIFHRDMLLFLGGSRVDVEGYDIASDAWVIAPYKMPEELGRHYTFMMDLRE